jgi:hypothetical protein
MIGRMGPKISLCSFSQFNSGKQHRGYTLPLHQDILAIVQHDNRGLDLEPGLVRLASNHNLSLGPGDQLLLPGKVCGVEN